MLILFKPWTISLNSPIDDKYIVDPELATKFHF